jgi:hypothetical protein
MKWEPPLNLNRTGNSLFEGKIIETIRLAMVFS